MLGLDCAGKTTIQRCLAGQDPSTSIPTVGFHVEEVPWKGMTLSVWDVGGQDKLRALWRHYYRGTSGIIFVIDSNDKVRFPTAKQELLNLMKETELAFATVLVIANKQDLKDHADCEYLKNFLELDSLPNKTHILPAIANKNIGLGDAMEWLTNNITEY